ncbi:MAG: MauE/DoxX family redox-associated membrane protein [candidate division Zixibacteria bacterium]
MRRIIDNDYLTILARLIVGGVFIYASFYKIIDPGMFAKSIWFYHMVPGSLINLMALILPWLELLCGLGLILGLFYRGSVVWANLMTLLFIVALTSTIVRGIDIDCGCFKASSSATGSAWNSLLFDFGLLALTIQLALSKSCRWMISTCRCVTRA